MFLSGFASFQKKLPDNFETLLRKTNSRGNILSTPIISATLALKDDPRVSDPIERAVSLLLAARGLYQDITSGSLEPDKYRDQVLEMGQYPNLFSTCLIVDGKRSRIYKSTNTSFITLILHVTGMLKVQQREVLVSHPQIYPVVPIVGRPGVRLPYVKYFGLHYQIMDNRIVVTLMPSTKWQVANSRLMETLEKNLRRIEGIVKVKELHHS